MANRSYRTVAAWLRHEPEKVKGSRHIATVAPVTSEEDVAELMAAVRAELPAANHHAFAWRLGVAGDRFRSSDDGEPPGSAGKPILMQIDRMDLTRTAVVVSRIFGGTKLGAGGLVRAYGGAAAEALERAEIVTRMLTAAVTVEHAWEDTGAMKGLLHRTGFPPRDAEYGEKTRFVVDVPVVAVEEFLREVGNATAGRAVCSVERPDAE